MFKEKDLLERNGESALITKMDWLKLTLISLVSMIPFVGFIVLLVLYIYLALSNDTAKSIKNYLIVELIISIVVIIAFLLFFSVFSVALFTALPY